MAECIFQRPDERFGTLVPDGLAVALSRVTQDDPEHPGLPGFSVCRLYPCGGSKVDLSLVTRQHFDSTYGEFRFSLKLRNEPANTVVLCRESMLGDKALMNSLSRQPLLQLGEDRPAIRLALTPGARFHRQSDWGGDLAVDDRPGGRFWPVLKLGQMLADRLPMDIQQLGDLGAGVAGTMERLNCADFSHCESICHVGGSFSRVLLKVPTANLPLVNWPVLKRLLVAGFERSMTVRETVHTESTPKFAHIPIER